MNSQTTELPDEAERAAFEAEFIRPDAVTWDGSKYQVREGWEGSYRIEGFLAGWRAWQARAALEHAQRVAQPDPGSDAACLLKVIEASGFTSRAKPEEDIIDYVRRLAAAPSAGEAAMPLTDEKILYFARHAADRIPESNYEGRVIHAVRMALDAAMASGSAG